jgi:hypothetical protein
MLDWIDQDNIFLVVGIGLVLVSAIIAFVGRNDH